MLCRSLGLGLDRMSLFRADHGGLSLVEVAAWQGAGLQAVLRCTNYTAHLGRWAPPLTEPDPESLLCGPEGCF